MPVHHFEPPRGRTETVSIDSRALAGNLIGDPAERVVAVYLPEDYDHSDADYPLLVALAGFTGSGLKHLAWQSFGESLPQRIDRLVADGKMGPVILALPDCFTSLGGNQYVNSVAMGNWEDFLLDEMLPVLEERFRIRRGPAHRAAFGKSSGGYGAMIQGLKHGDRWAGIACHSGDCAFDVVFRRDLPLALDVLAAHGGDVTAFVEHLRDADKIQGHEMYGLMILALAATYDPDPTAPFGVRLPVDPETAELDPQRWSRWLEHDPIELVERAECQESLRSLRGLFIDCGRKDQYFLHYGARSLVKRLKRFGIRHRFEEFDDNHSGLDYRFDVSLPFLYKVVG